MGLSTSKSYAKHIVIDPFIETIKYIATQIDEKTKPERELILSKYNEYLYFSSKTDNISKLQQIKIACDLFLMCEKYKSTPVMQSEKRTIKDIKLLDIKTINDYYSFYKHNQMIIANLINNHNFTYETYVELSTAIYSLIANTNNFFKDFKNEYNLNSEIYNYFKLDNSSDKLNSNFIDIMDSIYLTYINNLKSFLITNDNNHLSNNSTKIYLNDILNRSSEVKTLLYEKLPNVE